MLRRLLPLAPISLVFAVTWALPAPSARAHLGSTKYLLVDARGEGREVAVGLSVETVDVAMQLGLAEDAPVATVLGRAPEIRDWVRAGLVVRRQHPCVATVGDPAEEQRDGRSYLRLELRFDCAGAGEGPLVLRDDTVFPDDRQHEALVYLAGVEGGASVLRTGQRELPLEGPALTAGDLVAVFVWEGVLHFALGYDHILFLLSLILGVGLAHEARPSFKQVLRDLAWLVTAFTLGHSVTLALAALEVVVLPSRPVEITIAASIVAVAVHTLLAPRGRRALPYVAGGFGLVHGFGFSSVLREIGLPASDTVLALVSFNVGIELAQLAFVVLALGPLLALARRPWYERRVVRGGSLLIALVASYWVVERVLGG